jgi:hypothetical protein
MPVRVYEQHDEDDDTDGPEWRLNVMPSPAPEAELAGGVDSDATPVAVSASPSHARTWRWAGFAVFLVVIVALFDAYLHLSKTYPENSDEANILLMANDMLHGNVFLHGWNVSDVPFITTELPEIAVLVWLFGLHLNTAHIAAAVTYTLVVAIAMLLAKGHARGPKAVARMALALAIMLAPQPGIGVFVMIFSVGHIGTAAPVMLTWLVLDRFAVAPLTARRNWWVPVVVAVMLGWALMADPLVLVIAIYPMLVVCLARLVTGLFTGIRNGPGVRAIPQVLASRWLELSLAAAAGVGYLAVWIGRTLLTNAGGYVQQPVPFSLDGGRWFMQARVVVHGLLTTFGAYFVPGHAIEYLSPHSYVLGPGLSGLEQAFAISRVVLVVMAVWGACAIARRFFFRDADFVSQLLLVGIVANLAAYIPSSLADHTALNVREVAPVLPFAAVIAGRMLGDRLLWGPVREVRLPARPIRWLAIGRASGGTGGTGGRSPGKQLLRRPVKVKLLAVPLVVLFGWYSFGLYYQADTPAAPNPFAGIEAFLEADHLTYGIGGYWNASVITVDTGGAVTIRAVTPACLQPYQWESKNEWYDPTQHVANFLLLTNVAGYFSKFSVSKPALDTLNAIYPADRRLTLGAGGFLKQVPGQQPVQVWDYSVRWYQGNLLADLPKLDQDLNNAQPSSANPHPKLNAC